MATIYKLIIEDDEGKTTVYPLSQGEISIGRKEGNTIRLMERNVSRKHARLSRLNGSIFIEDLDSYNGIRINGERINGRYEVKEGDLVEIGDYHLALQAAEIEEDAQSSAHRDNQSDVIREEWPAAGTVPDFRLPEEILRDVRGVPAHPRAQSIPRDTIVDTPIQPPPMPPAVVPVGQGRAQPHSFSPHGAETVPALSRDPLISPPPRGQDPDPTPRSLPPFPGPGGLPLGGSPFSSRPSSPADLDMRPPQLKPAAPTVQAKRDELPTVPLAIGPARVSGSPRLVCVSTSYAGKEFPLTRPELIIGRVEDNDIVIEHRSVSRNHAKIVFDGRTHKIIDLQSANGILVNGEEYAMTDLRRGDLIELGHVRFRFVPGGEPFVPSDDELREMRDAGVAGPAGGSEPPRPALDSSYPPLYAPPVPPQLTAAPLSGGRQGAFKSPEAGMEVPTLDPSMAATVTDTPLSALAMGQMLTPQIESPPSSGSTLPPSRKNEAGPQNERSPRSDTAAPRQALPGFDPRPADQRPTSVNINQRTNGSAHGGAAAVSKESAEPVTQHAVAIEPLIEESEPKSRLALLITAVVIALALIGLVFVLVKGQDGSNDRQLEDLVKRGQNRQALEFYNAKSADHAFKDEKKALGLAQRAFEAETERERAPKNGQPATQEVTQPPPATDERGAVEPLPPGADPAPDMEAGEDDSRDDATSEPGRPRLKNARRAAPNKAQAARAKAPPVNPNLQKAKEFAERGRVALIAGDLNKAEEQLTKCVKLAPIPDCYRNLGILYGHADDSEKAIYNYREYLKLKPNASDADKLRALIGEPAPSTKPKN